MPRNQRHGGKSTTRLHSALKMYSGVLELWRSVPPIQPRRMSNHSPAKLARLGDHHNAKWRNPAQVVALWEQADKINPDLLSHKVRGDWWDVLARLDMTLLVTREYEHLVLALRRG